MIVFGGIVVGINKKTSKTKQQKTITTNPKHFGHTHFGFESKYIYGHNTLIYSRICSASVDSLALSDARS